VGIEVHDPRLPGGVLEVDTTDPAAASAAAKKYLAANAPAPPPPPAPKPNTYADIVKSAASGTAKGGAGIAGGAGDISDLIRWGMNKVGIPTRDTSKPLTFANGNPVTIPGGEMGLGAAPDSGKVNADIQSVTGPYHKPETMPGRYAETIMSFAPAALAPGSLATRLIRPVLTGVGSEAAGQLAEGAGLSPGMQTVARAGGALASLSIPSIASAGLRVVNKGAEALTGSGFLNPNVEAAKRLTKAFASDGGLDTAVNREASFANSGASNPSVLDLGGGNVRRLVRAAAGGGDEAHNVATTYADKVRSNLQDNVISRAGQLTPGDARTAGATAADLEAGQGNLANDQYRVPYSQPAAVTPEMVSALQGPEGRGAINQAYATARANRDAQAMAELSDLRDVAAAQSGGSNPLTGRFQTLDQALANLSAGSLDRVRIAMRETGRAFSAQGRNGMAGGYFGRVRDIDTALDQTPGLTNARASYRQMQASRDAVDTGATVLTSPSANYAAQISDLASVGGPPNLRPLQVGARQAITDAVEAPSAGATGVLTKLGTSNRATANLANTFGAERAASFQEAVRNEVSRLRNANFISPETGSQTALRGADESLVAGIPTSIGNLVSKIADKIFRGTQLTAAEREAIVRLGTSEADIRRFATQRPPVAARAAVPATIVNSSRAQGQ
jgi:hypothetical protein